MNVCGDGFGGRPDSSPPTVRSRRRGRTRLGRGQRDERTELLVALLRPRLVVERGGRVRPRVVSDRGGATLKSVMREHILLESMIFTDEWPVYRGVDREWRDHQRIKHKARVYVDGDIHTQTIEGFFGLVKTGIRGVYHSVSTRYLQNYLDEYAFRYNRRNGREPVFWAILDRLRKPISLAA